jgi:hypothetical protein
MGTGLSDLFRFKKEVSIKNPKTGKVKTKVWVRLMGDEDLKEAYKAARVVSAIKRTALQDDESADSREGVTQLTELSQADLKELILAEAENRFITEAPVIVDRENLPEIEEVAALPDAPTLEEQEVLDKKVVDQDKVFLDSLNDYVETKKRELAVELDAFSEEELFSRAKKTLQNVQPLQAFAEELNNQKGFRATFTDKDCKVRGFSDVDDFRNSNSSLKQQIIEAYDELDLSSEDLKE